MAKQENAQDLATFESDFTWEDTRVVDDTESTFFGGISFAKL
ncbi:hypothetical protein [Microbacterium sp. LWH10-1.2]